MSASSTDCFIKVTPTFSTTIGSGGVSSGVVETIPLDSVTDLPTDTAVELVINRINASTLAETNNYETVRGVISGSNLTSAVRGVEGTAQAWDAGTVVEYLHTGDIQNRMVAGILIEHAQTGKHGTITTTGLNDTNGNELIKVTATTSAVNEITLVNAATNTNPTLSMTGGDSNVGLDIKMKGTGALRKPTVIMAQVVGSGTDTATGDGKAFFKIPAELNGMNLIACGADVYTAGTTNTTDIQIRNKTDSVDMLSTKITIDSGETSSDTAATAAVIDTTKDDVATGDVIAVDVDAVNSTPAKGLVIWLRFSLP